MATTHPTRSALAALDDAQVWLNSEPLTADALRGRVVLVDIWTYTCVNWLRTLPYVRAWADRYRDRGLVVVGVHAPEFSFEHDLDNVRRAARELRVDYPVVLDNDFAIWRSFENRYWPAVYLVDGEGRNRFHHFGEGNYEQTERAIQDLLCVDEETVRVDAGGLAEAADWDTVASPETYVGYARGERRSDSPANRLVLNQWALDGEWSVRDEAVVLETPGGSIAYRFQARDLNLVLGPPALRPGSTCSSMVSRLVTTTVSTSTGPAKGPSPSRGCISSSASVAWSPSVSSRSGSVTRGSVRTSSRSASGTTRTKEGH